MKKGNDWSQYKNILCIRPDNIGDVIMTTPALRALKEQTQGRKITLLTSKMAQSIVEYIPYVDNVIIHTFPWVQMYNYNTSQSEVEAIINDIKQRQFDAAVIFNVYSLNPVPSIMLAYLARIPNILAYSREKLYGLANYWVPDYEPLFELKHEVRRQLDLVAMIGAHPSNQKLSLKFSKNKISEVKNILQTLGINSNSQCIVMHIGVSEKKRQYPIELFSQAGRQLIERGYKILLTGTDEEKALVERVKKEIGSATYSLAGMLDLGQLIALIDISSLIISNNTAPVHIAAAVNTPVIVLYATTNPQHLPWMVTYKALLFDVQDTKSANVIVKYVDDNYFRPVSLPQPDDIVQAVEDVLKNKHDQLNNYGEVIHI